MTDNLRANLDALPGVASAEVVLDDDSTPLVRVWLDGTLGGDEVRSLVDELVASSMPSVVLPQQKVPRKRIGLGRGLGDLLSSDESDPVPIQLQPSTGFQQSIVGVAVVESADGVTVEIESDDRGVHCESVTDDGDIDNAVLRGVAAIVGVGGDVRTDITDLDGRDGLILVVTAVGKGGRSAGAAFVEYGRPYAIARACLAALRGL
jgi:hypothetical protein